MGSLGSRDGSDACAVRKEGNRSIPRVEESPAAEYGAQLQNVRRAVVRDVTPRFDADSRGRRPYSTIHLGVGAKTECTSCSSPASEGFLRMGGAYRSYSLQPVRSR